MRAPSNKKTLFPGYESTSGSSSTDSGLIDHGLLARYQFEQDANDWANGYHANVNGAPTYTTGAVEKDYALDADGTDDWLALPDVYGKSMNYSIMGWSKPAGFGTRGAVVCTFEQFQTQIRYHTDGQYHFYHNDGSTWNDYAQAPASKNTWAHVAQTYDGSTVTAYKDGAKVGSASLARDTSGTSTSDSIGATDGSSVSNFHNGPIDECRFYGRSLSGSEISDIYNLNG